MDRATTSRRALLGTVAAIGAAAVVPAASAAVMLKGEGVSPAPCASPDLLALIAEADRQNAEADRYEREVFDPASKRCSDAQAAIPHVSFEADYVTMAGTRVVLSTANRDQVATARAIVKGPLAWPNAGEAYHRDQRRLLAASKWRERASKRARQASGVNEAYDRTWALSTDLCAADMAVVAYPAATFTDLLAVMAHAERRGLADDQDYINALSSGIRRLAGKAQA